MIKFSEFLSVIEYINSRLRNNAIVVINYREDELQYYSHCDDIKTYKFIVCKDNDFCTDVNLLKVIKFFNSENYGFDIHNLEGKSPFKIFEYEDFKDEYILQIKDKRALRTFQMLLHYAKSIYHNTKKQDELMHAINLLKPEYEDDKKDFIEEFSFIFDDKDFVVEEVGNNHQEYYAKNTIDIVKTIKNDKFAVGSLKVRLRTECYKIIESLTPKYRNIEKYSKGGCRKEMFEEAKIQIEELYPICKERETLFTRNLFETELQKFIDKNPEYEYLREPGRKYIKEREN
ncbi:hypothetical protein [Candidatus Deianiraea vastatrix]|uniref:Uncharacterized protein n=1 Tax=Candidatus Deianiraea vastatrix TaxID=2163644 RepID=A0A5B8XDA1_9RICK|nr:hypothetical protein [Candidatus Deianiraea vastatrix]QED22996.1 hypothetical protein Deia_00188 [Candidatus Deianiraea vastatrix]